MTIAKGMPWGRAGPLPSDAPVAASDAAAARILGSRAGREGEDGGPVVGLVGGDLARTCGAVGDRDRLGGPEARHLPVDLGEARADGEVHHFVAHLVARRRWWRGRTIAIMNAEFIGPWDVAPRSHPNDGRLDVVDASLGWRDRAKARRRLPTGSHVPHPEISIRRVTTIDVDLDPGTRLWIDGVPAGPARHLSVRVIPDAGTIVV